MVTSVTNNASAPYDPTGSTATGGLPNGALGKEDFLSLLVAQLSHQDPMEPTDPTQFVSQLSQFSSLEQLMNLKDGLDLLAISQTAGTSAQMVSFIGKSVVYDGSTVSWHAGDSARELSYQLNDNPASVTVTIRDSKGTAVDEYSVENAKKGTNPLTFDGETQDGKALPEGQYSVEITAKDAEGNVLRVRQEATARVAGVTFENGYPEIVLGDGTTLTLGQVIKVLEQAPEATSTTATTDASDDEDDDEPAVSSGPHLPNQPSTKQSPESAGTSLPFELFPRR